MDNIAALVAEAREQPLPSFIPRSEIIRELAEPARFNLVEIITGMRRVGKTFYLYQKMSQLLPRPASPTTACSTSTSPMTGSLPLHPTRWPP